MSVSSSCYDLVLRDVHDLALFTRKGNPLGHRRDKARVRCGRRAEAPDVQNQVCGCPARAVRVQRVLKGLAVNEQLTH